jgi:hypothetical protein
MLHIGYAICPTNSSHPLSEEPVIVQKISMGIEDVHVPRILIFVNIWENNRTDWVMIYGFTSRSRIFHLYGDVNRMLNWT